MLSSADERIAFLRKRFREGDRFEGTVVRYIGPNRALIRIEGQTLAAWMQTSPPAGHPVALVVERLLPFVVLREEAAGQNGLNLYI